MAEPIDFSFGLWTRIGLKEAQVQSYLPGCANVPSWEGTMAPAGEYDLQTSVAAVQPYVKLL